MWHAGGLRSRKGGRVGVSLSAGRIRRIALDMAVKAKVLLAGHVAG